MPRDELAAHLRIHDPGVYRAMLWGGEFAAVDAYLDGGWDCDDLTALFRMSCRNLAGVSGLSAGLAAAARRLHRVRHWARRNTRRSSRRNIAAHYDLGNEFFAMFLDDRMMYSSAIFETPEQSLDDASLAKLDRICRSLQLRPGEQLMEIGTGWGGLALHAAREYGCLVTTTTISQEQHAWATAQVAAAGLTDRVRVLSADYRDLAGQYDKLVSIEMIEAVGHEFLPEYFAKCEALLRPGGRMLIQAITMPDQRYAAYLKSVDFIQTYVFPGGRLPSIAAMQQAQHAAPRLRFVSGEQFPDSYALTLREWRRRFLQRREDVLRLGFDERFVRLWEYYLCYCEAAFLERAVSVGQFVWERHG